MFKVARCWLVVTSVIVLSFLSQVGPGTPSAAHAGSAGRVGQIRGDQQLLERADVARKLGSVAADVTIDIFADFTCPDCAELHLSRSEELEALVVERNLRLTYRVYSIPRLMRGFQGAEAALCAGALHGRPAFKRMQGMLFERQEEWRQMVDPTPTFLLYAEEIDLPADRFSSCLARDAMAPLIVTDILLAGLVGLEGTPTSVFNRAGRFNGDIKFYGSQPLSRFEEAIDQVLAQ